MTLKPTLTLLSSFALATATAFAPLDASAQPTPAASAAPASSAAPAASGAFAGWGLPPSCGDFLTYVPPPANAPAPWLAFLQAAQTIKDYTVTVHEVDSSPAAASEDRVLKFAYALPCYARVEVVTGRAAGSIGVWHGGHKIKGLQPGSMSMKAIIPDVDPRATDLRGLPIYVLFIPYITSHLHEISSSITSAPGPAMGGKATDAVTFAITDPSKNYGLAKVVIYLDSATHIALGNDGFDAAGKNVLHSEMQDTVINPGLPDSTFSLPN